MVYKCCLALFCVVNLIALCGCSRTIEKHSNINSNVKNVVKYDNVPKEYQELILDYENIVNFRLSKDFETEYNDGKFITLNSTLKENLDANTKQSENWYNMFVEMTYGGQFTTKESFGYILKDLNGDGVSELFWVNRDYFILAVFTVKVGKAYLLDAFWSRYICVAIDSGHLYTSGSGGASVNQYTIRELGANSEFNTLVQFGTGGSDGKKLNTFYEVKDGIKNSITEKQFDELLSDYRFENGERFKQIPITFLGEN